MDSTLVEREMRRGVGPNLGEGDEKRARSPPGLGGETRFGSLLRSGGDVLACPLMEVKGTRGLPPPLVDGGTTWD